MRSTVKEARALGGAERLLEYFHLEAGGLPQTDTLEQAADELMERTGLILVPVTLEGDWYRTGAGPFLAQDQEGTIQAVLPDWRGRYYLWDEGTGRRVYLTARTASLLRPQAYGAVRDLPGQTVRAGALAGGLLSGVSCYEWLVLLVWSLLGGGLWVLLSLLMAGVLSGAVLAADPAALARSAAAALGLTALALLIVVSGRRLLRRGAEKGALTVLTVLGQRIYTAGPPEAADGQTAVRMAQLRDNGERAAAWLLSALCQLPALLVLAAALAGVSASGLVAGILAALVLLAGAAALFLAMARRPADAEPEAERREWFLRQAADRRLGVERPFPEESREPGGDPGWLAWPALLLLSLPVLWAGMAGQCSAARLLQVLMLYLPLAALPLALLLGAPGAGRALAGILALLPLARRSVRGEASLPPMGSVLELKDVTFGYLDRREPVLRGVSLRLHPGEIVGIWGPTGSGKTTLARLMTGALRPSGGNIYYGGVELARFHTAALRRRIAYDRGSDILLCGQVPPERDGRACVVFSSREEALAACDRVLCLRDGQLTQLRREPVP